MTWAHARSASAGLAGTLTTRGCLASGVPSFGPLPEAAFSNFGTGPLGCIDTGPDARSPGTTATGATTRAGPESGRTMSTGAADIVTPLPPTRGSLAPAG